ncbi:MULTISPECIES: peroxiredoxin [Methylobacterium]|jgi:peroxiredoxin (alkyl hydroperoxide reductase subunit C)|uniref:peroxiredoxin n=1 Tax=Methylobacterium TaxID=407 RepID=UPI0005BE74E4|nr:MULTISPECIES: peroxiredoxin [Methylobacterium]AWV16652.1 peroxiredoxin [Methylobacterium sp. XJLW]MDE4912146.1 peroxiredoxin [Methylobacterium sp. 092160098-2]SFV10158.1 peroxiredoxin (alkyl hydroperoxide reductase subunit C) [Methylobacterium sp. UNCCL125]
MAIDIDSGVTAVPHPAGPPIIGDGAPNFRARTTMGPRTLSSYRGRWLVFFSHPADFTPVCTSEFVAFARAHEAFQALDCDLLALSVDSLSSHLAWQQSIEQRFGVRMPFPIVEDPAMGIARAYGMLPAGAASSATVRTTFVIDPEGIVRALVTYPLTVGRSVAEILRLVRALQASDAADVSTPEGWQPGEPVLANPPMTSEEIGGCGTDWYYRLESV